MTESKYQRYRKRHPERQTIERERERSSKEKERKAKERKQRRTQCAEIRRERGCQDCGTKEGTLDFHHIDPTTKSFNIAQESSSHAWARILEEIAKCEVLCHRCHLKRRKRK